MARVAKTKKKKSGGTAAAKERAVTVRMYNVGFGDAFLVLVPDGKKQRRILFDCGSIESAKALAMNDVVERIIHDVTDPDGIARIDVVVATHRHKDHVSGFGSAAWSDVEVNEVWMPWTEHPTDPEARRVRDIQSRLALGLHTALTAKAATLGAADRPSLERDLGIVENALMLTNDREMKTLHSGFVGDANRRFLPERKPETKDDIRSFKTDALPGVTVHVLGPSRQGDVIRDMDPPKGESYLRLHAALAAPNALPPAPFPGEPRQTAGSVAALSQQDMLEIQRAGSFSDLAVAVALDKAVNGTSLMLVLEVAGTYLLFPGDAQWGTWNAVMEDPEWVDMLKRVSFYKIGHHGSHNATPKDFVEQMIPEGLFCMASTLTRKIWPDIPRKPLLSALEAKHASVARSDQLNKAADPFHVDDGVIELSIPL